MAPKFSKVLVTTDFSDVADRAVPYAYGLVAEEGEVHLLHIIEHQDVPSPLFPHYSPDELNNPEKRAEAGKKIEERLAGLIPKEAEAQGITTRCAVGFHPHVGEGIIENES